MQNKIHIGCGKRNFGEEWHHVDGGDYDHIDSKDIWLKEFKPSSAKLIYASHFIEYFDRYEVVGLLKVWKMVLENEGILRLAVPDFGKMAVLYSEASFPLDSFLGPLYGRMDMGDEKIYHKTTYDYKGLEKILKNVGFSEVRKYDWRETEHSHIDDCSQAYLPHMDKENGVLISLNVEAIK